MLEQGRHELAAQAERELGGERLGIGERPDPVGAEETAQGRLSPPDPAAAARPGSRVRRKREGLTRSTVTPLGVAI